MFNPFANSADNNATTENQNADDVPVVTAPVVTPDDKVISVSQIYTYVGSGEESPKEINFMGRQTFVLGEPQEVTDKKILSKISNNKCFEKAE